MPVPTMPTATGVPAVSSAAIEMYRVEGGTAADNIHTDAVYNALMNAANIMEDRLRESLEN